VLGPRLLQVSAFKRQHTQAVAPRRASGSQEEAFDRDAFMQREEFDPLSLSSFRRDALLQYRNTNQSEPLRIGIFLLVALAGTCFPFFAPVNAGIQNYVAAVAVAAVGGFLFLRERDKRTKQLQRLQREYGMGNLSLEMSDPVTRLVRRKALRRMQGQSRIIALYGSELQLKAALAAAAPYRCRFQQSSVIVVPVPTGAAREADTAAEAALASSGKVRAAASWLGRAANVDEWQNYFEELLEERGMDSGRGIWVALNFKGRVIGSNFGVPIWDELLAANPPRIPLVSTEPACATAQPKEVLAAQAEFYKALCGGDEAGIARLFAKVDDPELSFALSVDEQGLRSNLSNWGVVLAEGARPELVIASQDSILQGRAKAVTTCIEFPVLGPSLLATQVWEKNVQEESSSWRLCSHRTIPYASQVEARVALRCDHRGCIAFGKQLDAMR